MNEHADAGILVSIIIPTFNRKVKLRETVEWICRSDFDLSRAELLIMDDGSTDGTEEINWPGFPVKTLYSRQAINRGPAAARNVGIRLARGSYLYFTDDDCLVPPHLLSEFCKVLESHPDIAGVGGGLQARQSNWISRIEHAKDVCLGISPGSVRANTRCPAGFTNNMMYRKRVLDEVGLFREDFKVPAGEDVELANRVVAKGGELAVLPTCVLHNHDYNINYLLGIMIKQGLNRFPPSGTWRRLVLLTVMFPIFVATVLRKVYGYRTNPLKMEDRQS